MRKKSNQIHRKDEKRHTDDEDMVADRMDAEFLPVKYNHKGEAEWNRHGIIIEGFSKIQ